MTSPRRAFTALCLAVVFSTIGAEAAHAGAYISKTVGIVQVRPGSSERWEAVKVLPLTLSNGDAVRTGLRASATLMFDDGSRVELGGNASFTLEEAGSGRSLMNLTLGKLKAFVTKVQSRRFQVKTPTAVCSVRGTEFGVEVMPGGRTVVDLYKGLLGVEDKRGQQILLHPNERVQVDLGGMGEPSSVPTQGQVRQNEFRTVMRREMSLDMSKEEVQAAAAREIKLAEFMQGKVLVDVFGQRVRLEEYIIRPSANQFKLVVLNERANRFDYFYYLGTFNTNLPQDLRLALRELSGTVDNAPSYWLTSFETGRSNTQDSMVELGNGGHPVDVNNNADPGDDVAFLYNYNTDKFDDVSTRSVFKTHFDNYGFYINGNVKYGWTGNNIQTYNGGFGADSPTAASANDPITGAALAQALPTRAAVSTTFPSADQIHQVIYESYSDGTYIKWDNYIIDDEGRVATTADFEGVTAGAGFRERLLNFNYQQVITASEFGNRKIDLVVEPKILIQSGLIQ